MARAGRSSLESGTSGESRGAGTLPDGCHERPFLARSRQTDGWEWCGSRIFETAVKRCRYGAEGGPLRYFSHGWVWFGLLGWAGEVWVAVVAQL